MSEILTPPKALTEKAQKISAKQKELSDHLAAHKTDEGYKMNEEQRKRAEDLNKELNDLGKEYDSEKGIYLIESENQKRAEWLQTPVNSLPHQVEAEKGQRAPEKSLGELFTEAKEFKGLKGNGFSPMSIEVDAPNAMMGDPAQAKTLMMTSTSWAVQPPPISFALPTATRRLVVADLLPQRSISVPWASWMEETTFTNNAAITAEGDQKPESALAWTRRDAKAVKIANSIPVTTEQLEDIPGIQGVINGRLTLMVQYAEEVALLNNSSGDLIGLTQLANILTWARTSGTDSNGDTDNNVDAIFRMFTLIRATGTGSVFAEPNFVVMHPTNWQTIRLMKTTDGAYIWGAPSEQGGNRVWGVNSVATPAMTLNSALVGDSNFAQLDRYKSIMIQVGWVNNQFRENERTILAEERIILEVYKHQAFGLVTALN